MIKRFLTSILLLHGSMFLFAQEAGTICLGYCDGFIANATSGHITGSPIANANVSLSVAIPGSLLQPYAGNNIVGVHWGLPSTAFPDSATVWVRTPQQYRNNSAPLAQGTYKAFTMGWNKLQFTSTLPITSTTDTLWFGVDYPQTDKIQCISFAGDTNPMGCAVKRKSAWSNFDDKEWGSLSLEAIIEGDLPTHDLAFLDVQAEKSVLLIGTPVTIKGYIKNNASTTAIRPLIRYTLNESVTDTFALPNDIAYRETQAFSFQVPTTSITQEATADIHLELLWADGSEDLNPADNVKDISAEMVENFTHRIMLVEEHTGAWCGWCVGGIVGMEYMRKTYPDQFIGIAIHSGDMYATSPYTDFISNYLGGAAPRCTINRSAKDISPYAGVLEQKLQEMSTLSEAILTTDATYNNQEITFKAHAKFIAAHSNVDYRVAFVLVEDSLPIVQSNYYSGGGNGEMGGFEKLGSKVKINVDDVARAIYPSVTGVKGSLPANLSKTKTYDYSYTTALPTYVNTDKLWVVAMIINNATGEILQAAKTHHIEGLTAIDTPTCIQSPANDQIYTLDGRKAPANARGLLIQNGRKIFKK